ncbi:hypothetical protein J1605_005094 [Eschrichtius robustus]|uniref:Phosphatidylinositol 5-phosphate 4-kinase type-2 alpha n=1 Tax=Eschrichtius robustus TaxID=9764 RepID=A0AB34HA06_ESCRO|nr:hypothetical protein J1605_005094 [Eschrichtius robustus]
MKRVGKAAEEMIRDRNREEGGPGSASIHEVFLINELSHVQIPVMLMPDDFKAYSKIKVDNHLFNKENMPSHFKFKEYCPMVFRNLRERFGIDDQDFQNSLTRSAPLPNDSQARSGARFHTSYDKRYIIKTITSEDVAEMHNILKKYHQRPSRRSPGFQLRGPLISTCFLQHVISRVTGPSRKPTACGVRIPTGDGSQCRKRKRGGLDRGEGRLPGGPPQDTANLAGPFGVLYPHAAMLGQRDRKAGPEGAANQRLRTALQSRAARPPRARNTGMLGAAVCISLVTAESTPSVLTYIVECHGITLLPQFLGMYRLNVDGVEIYVIVTRNVFSHRLSVYRKYDLKGSTVAREASDKEKVSARRLSHLTPAGMRF